ncbi:MAG: DUF1343 domain-containing protein [Firmicutes bacterium]|nr:DUF1343 domain-containing protein [Bacillota bacterium]
MVSLGVDQLFLHHRPLIQGRRLGLVSHYAMTDSALIPVIDRFLSSDDCQLVRLFGPEHGVLNAAREGEVVNRAADPHSGLEAVSLYGQHKAPLPGDLKDLDALIVDLFDIGTRYYTNASTLYYTLEAAQEAGLPVIVLDRPNPLGGLQREGHLVEPQYSSFVGKLPVPIRHGLTLGEEARLIQGEFFPRLTLHVIPAAGWSRSMLWPDTGLPFVSSSPNTTHFDMTLLYPGTCLFEGTNVSVGRGTTHPFEWIGAPWIDGHRLADWFNAKGLRGIRARPVYFVPWRSLYAGELVSGVQLHVTDAQALHSLRAGITLLEGIHTLYPELFHWTSEGDGRVPFFDLLAGDPALRHAIAQHAVDDYFAAEAEIHAQFRERVGPYLLYR